MNKRSRSSMADLVLKKAKEAKFSGGSGTLRLKEGMSFFKPKKGRCKLIVVPFEIKGPNLEELQPDTMWYRFKTRQHYNIGPESKAVVCPTTIGKRCPICEHRAELIKDGADTKDPEVLALNFKLREYYNVIDLEDKESAKEVKVMEMSYHTFGKKLETEIENMEGEDDEILAAGFADPDEGAILKLTFEEERMGAGRPFVTLGRVDFIARDKPLSDEMLDMAIPFGEALVIHSYEDLQRLHFDLDDDAHPDYKNQAHDDDDVLERPAKRKSAREDVEPEEKSASKKKVEEAEYGPAASQEDKEEESRPARKRKREEDEDDTKSESNSSECPEGAEFGKDNGSLDECEECLIWAKCRSLQQEILAKKKKK